jgi:uncharacterized protein YbbK (DUF523 family)/uncharacterized protein YbgA (DUF1722 family)
MSYFNRNTPVKLAISSCLLGENVRYDGKNKRNQYILGALNECFAFTPICPEVAIGLGTPRPTIDLVTKDNSIRAIFNSTPELDLTARLRDFAETQSESLNSLCGYIVKARSPSCGLSDAVIISTDEESKGPGIYTQQVIKNIPHLPVVDEIGLTSDRIRDNFLERVFILSHWHKVAGASPTAKDLETFHANCTLALKTHHGDVHQDLSGYLLSLRDPVSRKAINYYLKNLMECLKIPVTMDSHTRVIAGLRDKYSALLSEEEGVLLATDIKNLEEQRATLFTVTHRLRELAGKYHVEDLCRQTYLNPPPAEIALRFNETHTHET